MQKRMSLFPYDCVLALLLLAFCMQAGTTFAANTARELLVLNWSDYMVPEVLQAFEKETGIRVKEVYYESDDLRDDMLVRTNGGGYDLALVNGIAMQNYIRRGWLAPITGKNVPNLVNIDSKWRTAMPDAYGFGVPYFWGTLGIAYRKDLVPEPITTWKQFFKPRPELQGKIAMIKASRDVIGMALKSLGYSINSADPKEINEARELLLHQKPYVSTYTYIGLNKNSTLVSGETVASFAYNGDAMLVAEHHPDIVFVVPQEGTNIWVDYWTVMKASPRKDDAYLFLDYINKPEIAARLAQSIYYASPNREAEKLLPKEFLEDTVVYPDKGVLSRSEAYTVLPPRVQKLRNSVFTEVTR